MATEYLGVIIGIIISVSLLVIGFFLLVYKKKLPAGEEPKLPDWFDQISEQAKSIHLKERNKQTQKIFTPKWFLEYWHGQRTAFSAWLTWAFIGKLIVIGILAIIFSDQIAAVNANKIMMPWSIKIPVFMYSILSAVILWKCAANSTQSFKYFARGIAILSLLK